MQGRFEFGLYGVTRRSGWKNASKVLGLALSLLVAPMTMAWSAETRTANTATIANHIYLYTASGGAADVTATVVNDTAIDPNTGARIVIVCGYNEGHVYDRYGKQIGFIG